MSDFEEFWQEYRGVKWHVKIIPRSKKYGSSEKTSVDIYLTPNNRNSRQGDPASYPHVHVYTVDFSGTNRFATFTWGHGKEPEIHNHLGDIKLPGTDSILHSLNQYILDLIAHLGESSISIEENTRLDAEKINKDILLLKKRVGERTHYNDIDWQDAKNLSSQLQELNRQKRILNIDYQQNRQLLDDLFGTLKNAKNKRRETYEQNKKNYDSLKLRVERTLKDTSLIQDTYLSKQNLIDLQKEIKSTSLQTQDRQELFNLLQKGFEAIKVINDKRFAEQSLNYEKLRGELNKAIDFAKSSNDIHLANEQIKQVQENIRIASLSKQSRDELKKLLQDGFDVVQQKRKMRETEQTQNENWLHKKIWECEVEVKAEPNFRLVRENLKKVAQQVREANLRREVRDNFKSRIDDAFKTLQDRQNRENRIKQEEYRVKLSQIVAQKRQTVERIEISIRNDEQYVSSLYDKYYNVRPGSKQIEIKFSIDNKISQTKQRIGEKREKIKQLYESIRELEYKIKNSY